MRATDPKAGEPEAVAAVSGGDGAFAALVTGPVVVLCLLLLLGGLLPTSLSAQQAGEQPAGDAASAGDTAGNAVYQREVFDYPATNRRNPFATLDAGIRSGPQFDNLVLSGVIFSPSIGSVAVLVDRSTGQRYRVRDGESLGAARVVEIRRGEVVFNVTGAVRTRREVLQVEKQERESQG